LTYASRDPFSPTETGEIVAGFALPAPHALITVTTRIHGDPRQILPPDHLRQIEDFIRGNTHRRFGSVAVIAPELVFELEFDALYTENRRSELRLSRPQIVRWCEELRP